jgi:hypothetical protein
MFSSGLFGLGDPFEEFSLGDPFTEMDRLMNGGRGRQRSQIEDGNGRARARRNSRDRILLRINLLVQGIFLIINNFCDISTLVFSVMIIFSLRCLTNLFSRSFQ